MFEQDIYMNSGTRMFTFAMMGNELVAVIYDARWFLATLVLCVLADFRYGAKAARGSIWPKKRETR